MFNSYRDKIKEADVPSVSIKGRNSKWSCLYANREAQKTANYVRLANCEIMFFVFLKQTSIVYIIVTFNISVQVCLETKKTVISITVPLFWVY